MNTFKEIEILPSEENENDDKGDIDPAQIVIEGIDDDDNIDIQS